MDLWCGYEQVKQQTFCFQENLIDGLVTKHRQVPSQLMSSQSVTALHQILDAATCASAMFLIDLSPEEQRRGIAVPKETFRLL